MNKDYLEELRTFHQKEIIWRLLHIVIFGAGLVICLILISIIMLVKSVSAYDFDHDGKDDILWQDTAGIVAVWLMDGGQVKRYAFLGGVPTSWKLSRIADVNGDGKADVIWRHSSGPVAVWLMDGITITSIAFPGSAAPDWQIRP